MAVHVSAGLPNLVFLERNKHLNMGAFTDKPPRRGTGTTELPTPTGSGALSRAPAPSTSSEVDGPQPSVPDHRGLANLICAGQGNVPRMPSDAYQFETLL